MVLPGVFSSFFFPLSPLSNVLHEPWGLQVMLVSAEGHPGSGIKGMR